MGPGNDGYKTRKEAFVSNLSGGTITEINLVTLVAPAAVVLWSALQSRHSFFKHSTIRSFTVDFLLNVCALLFAFTLYSGAPLLLNVLLIFPALILILPIVAPQSTSKNPRARKSKQNDASGRTSPPSRPVNGSLSNALPFLTHYRGNMLVSTCIAILAVDFPIFPRRFAKTENWGTSLMDLGVGSFVFSAGVVSARSVSRPSPGVAEKGSRSFLAQLTTAIRHSMPLLALGLIRLWSVKGLDYAEHVTEYGVHWNFFFTLALLPPFVEVSDLITAYVPLDRTITYTLLSTLLSLIYELVLNMTDLKNYILISPRGPDWLSKNREGVFSFIGYLAIFLAGRSVGVPLFRNPNPSRNPTSPSTPAASSRKSAQSTTPSKQPSASASVSRPSAISLHLTAQFTARLALYLLLTSLHTFNLRPSRRLANAPYVLWVGAFNTAQLLLFHSVEVLTFRSSSAEAGNRQGKGSMGSGSGSGPEAAAAAEFQTSRILHVFNKHGLVVFLVANLLTGAVNLSVSTLDFGDAGAMAVLVAYAVCVTFVALGCEEVERRWGVRLRL